MATDISKILFNLGLSDSETKVYLASLELGPTSVQEIAKKSRLSRTATYDAVASLQERGLMTTFERGKKRFYVSENPDRAVTFFRSKIRKQRDQLENLESILPELKMIMGGDRPAVRFYEGKEALFALFQDAAAVNPDRVDEVSNMEDVYKYLDTEELLAVRKTLDVSKLRMRILHRGELKNPREGVHFRELAPDLGEFHGDIWIYADRVVFVQFVGKILTVIIESQTLADTARVLFEAAWQKSKTE